MEFVLLLYIWLTANETFAYKYPSSVTSYNSYSRLKAVNGNSTPVYFDWRTHHMVTPVKNQQSCDACWAFSAVANIESQITIHFDREEILSEQFLINCDGGRAGCGNQSILETFARIVARLGGVLRDKDYLSYKGKFTSCKWRGVPKPVPVIGFRRVPSNPDIIKNFIYRYGPVSAGINSESMARYQGGIDEPTEEQCPPNKLNHAVLIVGYNLYVDPNGSRSVPYWIIKNSWGTDWGDNGYYYLIMKGNACGVTNDVSISIVN